MKVSKRNLLTVILAMLCAVSIALGVGFVMPKNQTNSALADSAEDIYNNESDNFSINALNSFAEKVGFTNFGNLVLSVQGGTVKTGAELSVAGTVLFGGQEWQPVYLSESDGKAVLTLWLAKPAWQSTFSDGTYGSLPVSQLYSTSYIHACINAGLTSTGYYAGSVAGPIMHPTSEGSSGKGAPTTYTQFADFASGGKFDEYILTPNEVSYQSGLTKYINDLGNTNSAFTSLSDPNYGYSYTSWGDDNLWLPSVSEVGTDGTSGVWGTSVAQCTGNIRVYLRSGHEQHYFWLYSMSPAGNAVCEISEEQEGDVRPAIHLNLSSIGYMANDVEVTYNGAEQNLDSIPEENRGGYTSAVMIPEYLDGAMKDAGDYKVNISLSPSATVGWIDGTEGKKQITFTINKKPLEIKFETDSVGFPIASIANKNEIYSVDGNPGDSTYPVLELVYYKKGTSDTTATSAFPNSVGIWIARAEVTNDCNYTADAATYEYEFEVNRRPIAQPVFTSTGLATVEQPYTGDNQTFTIEGVDTTKMTYLPDGNEVSSSLSGTTLTVVVKSAKDYEVKFTLRTDGELPYKWAGITDETEAIGQLTLTVKITKVAATVSYDPPVDNTDSTKVYSDWEWGINTPVKINASGVGLNNDDLVLQLSWVRGSVTSSDGGVALNSVNGSYLLPSIANLGTYTLCIELAPSGGDNANYTFAGKYIAFKITGKAVDFNSVDWLYKVDGTGTGTAVAGSVENNVTTVSLPYTGKEYSFFIDEDSLPAGLAIKSTSGEKAATDVGEHTTTVTIYSTTETVEFAETVFTLKYTITKGEYDINFVWVYKYTGDTVPTLYTDKAPEYNGLTVTLSLMQYVNGKVVELPAELSVKLSGNTGREKGNYTAKATITTSNANFNAPTVADFPWEITETIINVVWGDDYVYDADGNEYYTRSLLTDNETIAEQVEYYYYYNGTAYGEGVTALAQLYELAGTSKIITVTVEVRLKSEAVGQYRLNDASGKECREEFDIGDNKIPATLTVEVSGYYSNVTLTVTVSGTGMSSAYYTVEYYKAESLTTILEKVDNFNPNTADAGTYVAVVSFVEPWGNEYVLRPSRALFTIAPMEVAIPEVGEMTFNGYTLDLKDNLGGSYTEFAKYIEILGTSGRDAGTYTAYLTLTSTNYVWALPEEGGATEVKRAVKAVLTSEGISVSLDRSMLTLPWTINKAQLTANWNLSGKEGAVLNALAAYKNAIDEGAIDVELLLRYYDNDKNLLETLEFSGGKSYLVDAVLNGDDAKNFEFVNGVGTEKNATSMVEYTVPKNGMAAFMGNLKDFMTKTLLGLPVWLWFVIALAVLLFLIIIIAVAAKRRKSKEERLAKKEAKEEEKRRREEERQMQKEKLEAERELAKAKQEAELEKIRAQAGLGMAGMGAASMAMAQQPVAQPMQPTMAQQPMQQQMPVPQQQPMPQYQQPVYQYQQMPMGMPQQMPMMMPQYQQPQGGDNSRIAQLEMEVAKIKAESEIRSTGVDERMKTAYFAHPSSMPEPVERVEAQDKKGVTAELLGEAILSALSKLMDKAPEHPQSAEAEPAQNKQVSYPPDAVVTTTTTVDTTKNKPIARSREEQSEFTDVDGFYDDYQ